MKILRIAAASISLALITSVATADNIVTGAGIGGGSKTVNQGLTKTGPGALALPSSTAQPTGANPQEAPISTSRSNKKHGLATSGDQQAR